MVQFLIGDPETITRSVMTGTVSGFLMAVLLGVYFTFVQPFIDVDNLVDIEAGFWDAYGFLYPLICISFGLVLFGGRVIGWLFIRPVAFLLAHIQPEFSQRYLWTISAVLVWLPLTALSLHPYLSQSGVWSYLLWLFGIAAWVVLAGLVGGWAGSNAIVSPTADGREDALLGATITTGALTGLSILLTGFSFTEVGRSSTTQVNGALGLLLGTSIISLLALIPYILLAQPLVFILKRLIDDIQVAYALSSGLAWLLPGLFLGPGIIGNQEMGFITVVLDIAAIFLVGICGGVGGWVIGAFKKLESSPSVA